MAKMKQSEKKIDGTRLMTVTNYAKSIGVPKQTIYYRVKNDLIPYVEIDGVTFIVR